jgi:hypothetical protein
MAVKIPSDQIQNLQQIEAAVAGPDDANRLFIINGQINMELGVSSPETDAYTEKKEIFTVLVGPKFTSRQFIKANATASLAKIYSKGAGVEGNRFTDYLGILDADADWDDESGQVELRIEAQVGCQGLNQAVGINAFAFTVTILAGVPVA